MVSIRYKYSVGQKVFMGAKPVQIIEQREFWGRPSYRVEWLNSENYIEGGVLREDELDETR